MKINLTIIREELTQYHWQGQRKAPPWVLNVSYAQLYSDAYPTVWQEDTVYVIRAHDLPGLPAEALDCVFLCLGIPPVQWPRTPHELLYTGDDASPTLLLNQLNALFHRYHQWGEDMQQVIRQHRPLSMLGELCLPFTHNPISAITADYRMLFMNCPSATADTPDSYRFYLDNEVIPAGKYSSTDAITSALASEAFLAQFETDTPHIHPAELFGYRSMICNIGCREQLEATIIIDEVIEPLTDRHCVLAAIIRDYVSMYLSTFRAMGIDYVRETETLIEELLRHRHIVPEAQIISTLRSLNWRWNDRFFCFLLRSKLDTVRNSDLVSYARSIAKQFSACCYVIFDHDLFFLTDLNHTKQSRESILAMIAPTLRDNLLIISSSPEFHDFKLLYYYYQLSVRAMSIGMQREPTMWSFHVENYMLDILIGKCREHTLTAAFAPSGLIRLQQYDESHNTELTELLRVYLESERSIVDTISKTYIHRNTFLRRLERIKEISGLELDDFRVRLMVLLYFQMRDMDQQEQSGS